MIGDSLQIQWKHPDENDVMHWIVYYQYGNTWNYKILNRNDRSLTLAKSSAQNKLNNVKVSTVDRTGNESSRTEFAVSVL